MTTSLSIIIKTEDDLPILCKTLSTYLQPGTVLLLFGDLGAGKTTFTRTLAAYFQPTCPVNSPSYAIVQEYPCENKTIQTIIHIDLYRINTLDEIHQLSIDDYIQKKHTLCVIEWAEKIDKHLSKPHIKLEIKLRSDDSREFRFHLQKDQDNPILLNMLSDLFTLQNDACT